MRQHTFLTDLGFNALNAGHPGVLRASGGHFGGTDLGIEPGWPRNFLDLAGLDVTVARERKAVRASLLAREDAVDLCAQDVEANRPYGRYQHRRPRDIPHVHLEPR